MKMKKTAALLLAGVMAFSVAACGSSSTASTATASKAASTSTASAAASGAASSKAASEATSSAAASGASSSGKAAVSEATSSGASSGAITSIADLKGKTVGVQTGTTGDIYISDDSDTAVGNVERFNTAFEAVQALSQGKLDAVIIDDQPAQTFVKQVSGLKILDAPYADEQYAIAVKKGNSDLLGKINSALATLKSDGTFDKITKYYIDKEGETYSTPDGTTYPNGKLVMATNAEFPPYESYDDNNKIVGIDADFAKAICDKLGYELEISDMQFDSIITSVTAGKADFAMAGMTVTDERKQSVDFTDSYVTARQVVIVKG